MSRPSRAAAVKAASRIRGVYEWEACTEDSQRFQQMAAAIEDNFRQEEDGDNASEDYNDSAQSDASEDEESEDEGSYESSFVSKSDEDSDLDEDEEYLLPATDEPEDADRAPASHEDTAHALSPTALDASPPWPDAQCPQTPGPGWAVDESQASTDVLCPDTPRLGYAVDEAWTDVQRPDTPGLGYAVHEPWTPGAASPPLTSWTPGYYAGRSSLSPSPSPSKRQRLSRWVSGQLCSASAHVPGQSEEAEHAGAALSPPA